MRIFKNLFMGVFLAAGILAITSMNAFATNYTKDSDLTAESTVATGDTVILYDTSAGNTVKATIANIYASAGNVGASTIVTVGALDSGSITSGFGAIDNGTSNVTTGGKLVIDVDGSAIDAAGAITFGAGADDALYHDGTNMVHDAATAHDFSIGGTTEGDLAADGMNLITGDSYQINNTSVLNATTLGTAVVTSSLTTVGAMDSGSISSGFGNIDNGTSNLTGGGIWRIDVDGTALAAAGALNFGAGTDDSGVWWDGTNHIITSTGGINLEVVEASDYNFFESDTETMRVDFSSSTTTDTALMLWNNITESLIRVTLGTTDSGGTGYRALCVPNL